VALARPLDLLQLAPRLHEEAPEAADPLAGGASTLWP
jgi:hypothetical protein